MDDKTMMCDDTVSASLVVDGAPECDVCWCEDSRGHSGRHVCGSCGQRWHTTETLRGARVELSEGEQ